MSKIEDDEKRRKIFELQNNHMLKKGGVIDYFEIIKDDLRNMRHLSTSQLDFVKKLETHQLYEMIIIFNETTKNLVNYVNLN